jgi:hypothetical protein
MYQSQHEEFHKQDVRSAKAFRLRSLNPASYGGQVALQVMRGTLG